MRETKEQRGVGVKLEINQSCHIDVEVYSTIYYCGIAWHSMAEQRYGREGREGREGRKGRSTAAYLVFIFLTVSCPLHRWPSGRELRERQMHRSRCRCRCRQSSVR